MDIEAHEQLRREVRTAVFRAGRLRMAGRGVEAEEQLAGELAAAQAQLATLGAEDPVAVLRRWHAEHDAAFALAQLVCELVIERLPTSALTHPAPAPIAPVVPRPQVAFPPPPTGVPGLADLLDDMLSQQRRPRPPPA